ncbi:MAG TPA: tetratricopeptide repeat protein [Candidatus Acidoferrales bacterium]|nr:tetratricopeptide repeat protein [Candidatus Acidoferrales bacterium]
MKTKLFTIPIVASMLFLGISRSANAQSDTSANPLPDFSGTTLPLDNSRSGTIQVYVRREDGEPLSSSPKVSIIAPSETAAVPIMKKTGDDTWTFIGVQLETMYEVQVQAAGYHTELRPIRLLDTADVTANMIIFMRSPNDELSFHPPSGQFVLAPDAEKEAQKGSMDLDSGKIDSAEKHLRKALGMAADNPYVNYLMGMCFFLNGDLTKARPYLEKSVSADARQVPALVALGTLRFQQNDFAGAIQVLAPAAQLDASKWNVHSMLAGSYLKQKDFANAREQAEMSIKQGGAKAGRDQLVLGEALAGLGQREKAVEELEAFLQQYPKDTNDTTIRAWIPELKKPLPADAVAAQPIGSFVVSTEIDLPPRENWAPPNIDAKKPFIISGASCPLTKVLKDAGKSATQMVNDLQEFSAKEEYESVELKRDQMLEKPQSRTFNYLVFITQPRPDIFSVQEMRDQGVNAEGMPGQFIDSDAALALVFHPFLQPNFTWSCEGLGEWNDKAAWIVRFEQRKDRPNYLAVFDTGVNTHSLPLKGLAWVSEGGGQVMHMETDLVHPISEIRLNTHHFVIDYKPVTFTAHKVTLWLPESVDVYLAYRGHYLHHFHRFSDFHLFWTGATQKISKPKEVTKKNGD